MKLYKWQEEIIKDVATLDGKALLAEVINLSGGDENDAGCFTDRGWWEFIYLKKELDFRLPENFKGFDDVD